MGVRFRKSIKLAKGVKVNINKESVSMTAGTKGAHYTMNSNGMETKSVSLPGTGLSYQTRKNVLKENENSFALLDMPEEGYLDSIDDSILYNQAATNKTFKLPKGITFRMAYIYIDGKHHSRKWVKNQQEIFALYSLLAFLLSCALIPLLSKTDIGSQFIYSSIIVIVITLTAVLIIWGFGVFYMLKSIKYIRVLQNHSLYMQIVSKILKKEE